MKRIIAVLMILTAGAAVFASGAQETNEEGVVELNQREMGRNSFLEDLDAVSKRGVIKFESPVPELVSGGQDYTLFAPGAAAFMEYIAEGDRVTVNGYIIDDDFEFPMEKEARERGRDNENGPRGDRAPRKMMDSEALEDNVLLLVESVEIDGVVYELPWVNADGPAKGRMGSNGQQTGRRS